MRGPVKELGEGGGYSSKNPWVHGGGGGATENIPTIPNHLPSGSSATLHLMLSFQFSKKQKRTTKNTSCSIYKSSSINKFIY